jgi:GAF domain-containing protein
MHPVATAVGGARTRDRAVQAPAIEPPAAAQAEPSASEEVLGVSSLARAVAGDASIADVGALSWMMLKQVLPGAAMGLFVHDEADDTVVGCYAAGAHAGMIRSLCVSPGEGVAGWVAAHRRPALNAEPAIDFGLQVTKLDPPLLSSIVVPLTHDGVFVAVLSVYATKAGAFTADHARLLDLLAPTLAASLASVGHRSEASSASPAVKRQVTADLKLLKGRRLG